jgi:hypothetical protein
MELLYLYIVQTEQAQVLTHVQNVKQRMLMNVLRTALGQGKEYGNMEVNVFSFRADGNLLFLLLFAQFVEIIRQLQHADIRRFLCGPFTNTASGKINKLCKKPEVQFMSASSSLTERAMIGLTDPTEYRAGGSIYYP